MLKKSALIALAVSAAASVTATTTAGSGIEALTTERIASNLAFPTGVFHAPGDYTRLYITEKRGRIRVLNAKTGAYNTGFFLNIDPLVGGGTSTNDERGLLGLAFHPDWQNNRTFFVYYTANNGSTIVAQYTATSPDLADAGSAVTTIGFSQPFSNHNGGWIAFGPNDDHLYIATGDGGSGGDPGNRAQDITFQRLGKMLRITPNIGSAGYTVPKDNPFVDATGDDEIWAYGLRNPWRNCFDTNGDMYIADVGQNAWEEISYQPADSAGGENYGWRCREGAHNFNFSGTCATQTFVEPIREYSHAVGFSITGGEVYRGCAIPTLDGTYFYADYGSNRIWSFEAGTGNGTTNFVERTAELDPSDPTLGISRISSFGKDARGEVFIVDQGAGSSGEIFKIVPVTPTISDYDFDCNGAVDFNDLVAMLSSYGDCDGCLADVNGDHVVDFTEVVALLSDWG